MQRYYFLRKKHYLCNKITKFYIKRMVSSAVKEVTEKYWVCYSWHDRWFWLSLLC